VGARSISAAVVDADPFIHLSEIGGVALLGLFEVLHLPDTVWSETVGRGRVRPADLLGLSAIHRHALLSAEVSPFVQEHGFETLQAGDIECLYLGHQLSVPTLLTDDLSVREAAKRFLMTPVGSLGVIVRAHRRGHSPLVDAERYLIALYDVSSLFVTRALVDIAIEQLRRPAGRGEG
jgi:predicted nucleic acid-binding protein